MLKRYVGLDDHSRRSVDVISRSGEHLLTLVSDILEMSRIESGRMTCDMAPCDLHELLEAMRSLFLLRARDKGLEIQLAIDPEVPRHVLTDSRKVRQIVANLIANAVKFTHAGKVAVVAHYEGGRLRIEVTDTGLGLGADEIKSLFQPFVQVRPSRARGEGTGLGLSISRGLTEILGGQLSMTSVEGTGSVFTLSIPVEPCAPAANTHAHEHSALRIKPGGLRPRVLIAEDHLDSRRLLRDLMTDIGADVREVGDGAEAVVCAASWLPDLIWMDIDMPIMDGLTAVRNIRASSEKHRAVIIALTAAAFSEDRNKIIEAGCDEVSYKPYEESILYALMERLLPDRFIRAGSGDRSSMDLPPMSDERLRSIVSALPESNREVLRQALIIGDLTSIAQSCAEWPDREASAAMNRLADSMNLDRLIWVIESNQPSVGPGDQS